MSSQKKQTMTKQKISVTPEMSFVDAKELAISSFKKDFYTTFNLSNCPKDNNSLESQARGLYSLNREAGIILGQRLLLIEVLGEWQKILGEDKKPLFSSFSDYMEGYLGIAKSTGSESKNVFKNFILKYFSKDISKLKPDDILNISQKIDINKLEFYEISKLKLFNDILKSPDVTDKEKKEITEDVLEDIEKGLSKRELEEEAKRKKEELNINRKPKALTHLEGKNNDKMDQWIKKLNEIKNDIDLLGQISDYIQNVLLKTK